MGVQWEIERQIEGGGGRRPAKATAAAAAAADSELGGGGVAGRKSKYVHMVLEVCHMHGCRGAAEFYKRNNSSADAGDLC